MTDLSGKLRALAPSFTIMLERTGKEMSDASLEMYAEHFTDLGLAPHYVNETVRAIMVNWETRYWPTAAHIGKLAQHRQRASLDVLPGTAVRERVLEDWCDAEGQRRWDSRVERANAWREANGELFRELWSPLSKELDATMATIAARHGTEVWLNQVPAYRRSFREGAGVGLCLAQEARAFMRLQRAIELHQRLQARANMAEDAAA